MVYFYGVDREIDKVIAIIGSQAKLARALKLSHNAVWKWVENGYVPPARAMDVAALVRGKKTQDGSTVTLESLLYEAALQHAKN